MSSWASHVPDPDRAVPHTRIEDESALDRKYTIGAKLGAGSFGVVKAATRLDTGEKWAIKIVNKEKAGSSAVVLLEREVAILKKVNHPNIIHLEEVFETSKRVYLLMEFCSQGELSTLYKRKEAFPEEDAKVVIKRLAKAVSYLHKNDIVHRDIKLENILLTTNPSNPEDKLYIKLTDFGLSVVKGGVGSDSMIQNMCGTPMYMAPEVIDNQGYSQQCDVWSIGVIAYTLMGGSPPFSGKDEENLYEEIRKGELDFTSEPWRNISIEGQNAVQGLLKVDPAHRLTVHELLDHPWITGDQSRPLKEGPSNVLEMMKQWKEELLLEDDGSKVDGSKLGGSKVEGSKVDDNANELDEHVVGRGQPTVTVDTAQPTVKTGSQKVINARSKVTPTVNSNQTTNVHSSSNKVSKNTLHVRKSHTSKSPVRRLSPITNSSSSNSPQGGKLSAPNSGRSSPSKPSPGYQRVRPHSTTATTRSPGNKTPSHLKSAPTAAHPRSPSTGTRHTTTAKSGGTSTVTASEVRRKKRSSNGS